MLRKHFGGQIYEAAREENYLRFHCLDVKVLGVNTNLGLVTVTVKEVMEHRMRHMVHILRRVNLSKQQKATIYCMCQVLPGVHLQWLQEEEIL